MKIKEASKYTSHGNNASIYVNVLSDDEMRELGFTDFVSTRWYLCKTLADDITFNIWINKDESDWEILVLDEIYGQHYDYQYLLSKIPEFEIANEIQEKVEDIMTYLNDKGIVFGHNRYDYI